MDKDESASGFANAQTSYVTNSLTPDWLKRRLMSWGIKGKDVPQAVGVFLMVKWGLYVGGLAACVKFQPLRTLARRPFAQRQLFRLKQRFPERYERIEKQTLAVAERVAQSPYVRPMPTWMGVDSKNFVFALAENTVLYKLLFPVYVPTTLYLISRAYIKDNRILKRNDTLSGEVSVSYYDENDDEGVVVPADR